MTQGDLDVPIEDEAVVTLELDPDMAAALELDRQQTAAKTADPAVEPTTKPVPKPKPVSAADEAAGALTEAMRKAEKSEAERKAVEATAEAERQARLVAERRAEEASRETQSLRETADDRQLTILINGIAAAQRDIEAATTEAATAMEAGDFKSTAAAQAKISLASAKFDRLSAEKNAFEQRPKTITPAAQEGQAAPLAASPFEAYVRVFPPKAQAWLRQHPDCVPAQVGGSVQKNAQMMAGHFAALGAGVAEGSDQYFEMIEQHIGARPAPAPVSAAAVTSAAGDEPAAKPKSKPRTPPVAAPVSGEGAAAATGATTTLRLTPPQQEIALLAFPQRNGEDEMAWKKRAFGTYANEYLRAKAAGQIGRLTH